MESFKKIQIFHFKKYFWQNVGSCLTYSAVCQTDTVSVLWLSSEKPGWAKKWRRQKRCWWARLVMPAPLSRAGSSLCSAQSYPGYSPNFFEPQFWSCLMNLIQSEHFAPTNTDPILNHLLYFELGKRNLSFAQYFSACYRHGNTSPHLSTNLNCGREDL